MTQQVSLSDVVDLIDPDWDKRVYLAVDRDGEVCVVKGHRLACEIANETPWRPLPFREGESIFHVLDQGDRLLRAMGIDLYDIDDQGPAIIHLKIPVLLTIEHLSS